MRNEIKVLFPLECFICHPRNVIGPEDKAEVLLYLRIDFEQRYLLNLQKASEIEFDGQTLKLQMVLAGSVLLLEVWKEPAEVEDSLKTVHAIRFSLTH